MFYIYIAATLLRCSTPHTCCCILISGVYFVMKSVGDQPEHFWITLNDLRSKIWIIRKIDLTTVFTLFSSPPCGLIISILWTILSTGPKFFFRMLLPLGPRRATIRLFPSHLRSAHFFMIWRTCGENKTSCKLYSCDDWHPFHMGSCFYCCFKCTTMSELFYEQKIDCQLLI